MTQHASFYFHDYETWGADPKRDRPAQFAGIRTDLDLNIIGEPDVWYCQLANDYLPHPQAALAERSARCGAGSRRRSSPRRARGARLTYTLRGIV